MNDLKAINAIRTLSIEAITKAKSGHPGIALGAAPIIYTLFTRHLRVNPKEPNWFDRDRFILSAGHGSSMLYSTLHLCGYDITIDDLKNFRQLHSKTPGHPELHLTSGIDAASGPLGQGISMGVGMSISESYLNEKFGKEYVDHYTYVLCGDGDLQEGISQEAISLAGYLKLNKLIVLYDSNDIQLDGPVNLTNTENTKLKYEAAGWNHILVKDGNDIDSLDKAIQLAKESENKPTIIEVKTIIGFGAPTQGTSAVHGAPLSIEKLQETKETLKWEYEPFFIPNDVYETFTASMEKGIEKFNIWNKAIKNNPELISLIDGDIDLENLTTYNLGESLATRNAAGKVINEIATKNTQFLGGSADLTCSTMVKGVDGNFDSKNRLGRNINFGVREHAMGAIANGIVLHGATRAFTGAFFVFSDYMKPAIRMAAIMKTPTLFMFSHDSIAVGEDGPTHQPVEQMTGLRVIPNVNLFRPCDANEMVYSVKYSLTQKDMPSVILSTRQAINIIPNTSYEGVSKGAYIISKEKGKLDGILLATGSEVTLALDVQKELEVEGIFTRVVSMPSTNLFDKQTEEYKREILPKNVKTLAIEMGSTLGWYKYANNVFGIDKFGISGPLKEVLKDFGFSKENIINVYKQTSL